MLAPPWLAGFYRWYDDCLPCDETSRLGWLIAWFTLLCLLLPLVLLSACVFFGLLCPPKAKRLRGVQTAVEHAGVDASGPGDVDKDAEHEISGQPDSGAHASIRACSLAGQAPSKLAYPLSA
jgi:hypothetical protein